MLDRLLTWAANTWLTLIIIITVFDFIGIFGRAPTVWDGIWGSVEELLNYRFYAIVAITSAPGFFMIWWRERRRDRGLRPS